MSKLGEQFSELRKSTPKYVQWLLLAAALVIVLILLTLLMTGPKNKTARSAQKSMDETPIEVRMITINADNQEVSVDKIDWANVIVGEKKSTTITIKTNAPTRVSMTQNKNIVGFSAQTTCTDATVINAKLSCNIYLKFEPTTAMSPETVTLSVYWRAENDPETMNNTKKISVVLGATAPVVRPEPQPIVEPEPLFSDDYDELDDYDEYDDNVEPHPTIRAEIESIAPALPFNSDIVEPAPVVERPSESCSDFAFPGYGPNGNQIGWIKPERGGYYFHPFSDKDCKNATGIYNPATGVITDISGNGTRIGTDAEHIGYAAINDGALPALNPAPRSARTASNTTVSSTNVPIAGMGKVIVKKEPDVEFASSGTDTVTNTVAYDRTFILRQYKPIPATIVSDVRADPSLYKQGNTLPVRATVDRNVYSDNGRTVIIPAGTMLLGYLTGTMPGPYTAIGRMEVNWYQFVLPNGVEFNFSGANDPFSGDAQGRVGVPGRGSTDYLEQFVMPMLTAIVPAAVNMIAPVADKFVNQIDLDNNTVVQSGTVRSSELAKNEIITAWNQVAQKLLVDMMDNTVPPFTIPAGTRITVYSPADLQVTCGAPGTSNKKCAVAKYSDAKRQLWKNSAEPDYYDGSWVGQARSFNLEQYCTTDTNNLRRALPYSDVGAELQKLGYSYSTLVAYCQASNYQAINNARQDAIYQNQQNPNNKNSVANATAQGTKTYNEQVLGLKYNDDGSIKNPYQSEKKPESQQPTNVITCDDGLAPDQYGCCTGEIYTDMGEQGFNCCPQSGGDCFPPIL